MKHLPSASIQLLLFFLLLAPVLAHPASDNGNHFGRRVSVSISPATASVQVNQSQQFTASISGTGNTAVTWQVNGVPGGTSAVGTISTNGVYTAPSAVPGVIVTITADSVAQPSASASAGVTVLPPPPLTVTISPASAALQLNQSQQFTATVSGTSSTGVYWLVNGAVGGTASTGSISNSGLYTAPSSVPSGSVIVTAQSVFNAATSATATVSVLQPVSHQANLSWSPSTSTVSGYNVYRSSQATTGYTRINSALDTATVFTDSTVSSGKTYFYAVTSIDSAGVESSFSNVVQAVIP
jgi:hypothetical protein